MKKITKLIILTILVLTILGINNVSKADDVIKTNVDTAKTWGSTEAKMPQNNISGRTGMFPQYWTGTSGRYLKLNSSRLSWVANGSWNATIDGAIVYCAERGAYVRYGDYDSATHYLIKGGTTIQGASLSVEGLPVGTTLNTIKSKVYEHIKKEAGDNRYYTGGRYSSESALSVGSVSVSATSAFKGGSNAIGYFLGPGENFLLSTSYVYDQSKADIKHAETHSKKHLENLLNQLGAHIKPTAYSADIDGTYSNPGITAIEGPEVVVLETSKHANDRYKNEGATSVSIQSQYVLTALENTYGEQSQYARKYDLNDIQTAYWLTLGQNPGSKGTANGTKLYQNAVKYSNFKTEISDGYNATIDSSLAQVIADRGNQEYIVGPFSVNYPDYTAEDISYVKSISINNGSLIYDESHSDFEIILESGGTPIPGANGMKKNYPKTGEKFFIKFAASKIGMATSINLSVQFEYISGTNIDTEKLDTLANIYKYYGYPELNGEYNMAVGSATVKGYYLYGVHGKEKYNGRWEAQYDEETGEYIGDKWVEDERDIYYNEKKEFSYRFTVYQPYIKMGEEPESERSAQTLTVAKNGKRTYEIKSANTNIDLSMELGGCVWEDAKAGKESIADGMLSNKENKIPNVQVTIYRKDGTEIAKTKTDENGKYTFSGLNAMYQYYIKFTYNGQYYQPTTYVGAKDDTNGWGKGTWKQNSNAADIRSQRVEYNLKFEKIGSSPENYKVVETNGSTRTNQTFTKEQLLGKTLNENGEYVKTREAVIDEFGNLILEESSDKITSKMIQYVKDCMIDAYTGKGDGSCDLYPVPSIFLIADSYKYIETPKILLSNGISGISILYDNAKYINLGLSQREQADLAIKKDIEKVTLEVNGQKHIYTYDDLENQENADKTWDINFRLSEIVEKDINEKPLSYYDKSYSREIYTADYLYKVSDYGTNFKELGKSKQDELEVYITYKIMVRNQALSIQTRVDEIVDYYDEDLSYIDSRSYIQIKNGTNQGKYAVQVNYDEQGNSISKYGKTTMTSIDGYKSMYIEGLGAKQNDIYRGAIAIDDNGNEIRENGNIKYIEEGIYLDAGQTAYVYLTFRVNKEEKDNEAWVKLDEYLESGDPIIENKEEVDAGKADPIYSVGKENIVEINGYSTRYAKGTTVPNVYETDKDGKSKLKDVGGLPAGIVDRDSNPGNLDPADVPKDGEINYENFEDDTDKAPNIRIKLNREDNAVRVISGTVFEDERTDEKEKATVGNGVRDKNETLINGVTVQLVELMDNGEEYIWRTFENGSGTASKTSPIINKYNLVSDYTFEKNHDGQYAFKSFMPGKYVVRFIYGDTEKTVLTKEATSIVNTTLNKTGLNTKSYNGQDFKSTTYQQGVQQHLTDEQGNILNEYKTYTWKDKTSWINGQKVEGNVLTVVSAFKDDASNNETANAKTNQLNAYLYDITESEKYNGSSKYYPLVSDAKDIESRRNQVNGYSNTNVTNHKAEVLASFRELPTYINKGYTATQLQSLVDELKAETQMTAETGLMVIEFEYDQTGTDGNKKDNTYKIQNLDLGLEERPKAQLMTDKEVTNVKLTLANGAILFDAKNTATNVLWRDHKAYNEGVFEGTLDVYDENFMKSSKFGSISNIRDLNANKFGLIQLSMDEELMHGATIEITYKITVTNIGEVDYKDNSFYYTGIKSDNAKIVKTKANKVIDYVGNNLQFEKAKNADWNVISNDNLLGDLVNNALKTQVEKYNTIIVTEKLETELEPLLVNKDKSSISVPLVLTQLITSENDSDDLSYRNIIEIVQTSNNVGRRMEYSVVGNQNPTEKPQELDSDIAEVVRILPPFGNAGLYIVIAIISVIAIGIIVVGIIFIKKEVLRK